MSCLSKEGILQSIPADGRACRLEDRDIREIFGHEFIDVKSPLEWLLLRMMRPNNTSYQTIRLTKDETRNRVHAWALENGLLAIEDPMSGDWLFAKDSRSKNNNQP